MITQPKVTVLVPSFNHGFYLKQRIESILTQTYRCFDLIVIDDASSDDSPEIIKGLLSNYDFKYIANRSNSGTPFAAWEQLLQFATGDYIWICESDDYADPHFLERAVAAITSASCAVMAYCDSWIVDEHGCRIDHTDTYFHEIWRESRWDQSFIQDGAAELHHFQIRGQTVPNMSSMLIDATAFRKAFTPFLKRLKLTGDWLFVGLLMQCGQVVYFKEPLNYFRRHESTARARVQSARSQAEFILTKHILFLKTKRPLHEYAKVMSSDAVRFLYEPAGLREIVAAMLRISFRHSLSAALYLAASLLINRGYFKKFYSRLHLLRGETCQ